MTAAILCALGFGALMTSLQSVAVSIVPREKVGTATSTYFLVLDAGVGPVVLGALLPVTGYSGMYLVLAGVVLLTVGLYWLVHGRKVRSRRPASSLSQEGRNISAGSPPAGRYPSR